jgi:uncharacterized OsmC-like protein
MVQLMGPLTAYLPEKAAALKVRKATIEADKPATKQLSAQVTAEGRSGIRRVRIRDFQVVTDAPPDLAGYNLGPSAPELLLGSLGSCLVHTLMIQAAWLDIPLDSADAVVTRNFDARTGHPAFPDFPSVLANVAYVLRVASPATDGQLSKLHELVGRFCPILNPLRGGQHVPGALERS